MMENDINARPFLQVDKIYIDIKIKIVCTFSKINIVK